MTITIAVAGKGGTGKTTFSALLIKYLLEQQKGMVLAIDADPSSNLNLVLGLPLDSTVGDIREDMLEQVHANQFGAGTSKYDYLDYHISTATIEGDDVDLLAMGRPEGQGCYCAVNNMLRMIIDRASKKYQWVIIDNEAGMEHLSRRTTRDVDILLIVTDPTVRGVVAARGIAQLASDLSVNVKRSYLIVNRLAGSLTPALERAIDDVGVELAGTIPYDPMMAEFDSYGRPLVQATLDSPAYQAVRKIVDKVTT